MTQQFRARLAGGLFLSAFLLYGVGQSLATTGQIIAGSALVLANSVGVASIGLLLRPFIAEDSPRIANLYLTSRLAEAVLLGGGILFLALAANGLQAVTVNLMAYRLGMIALALGSLGFCYWLFVRHRTWRWLSALGLVGYVFLALAMLAEFAGFADLAMALLLPGAIFELIFAIFLMVRGLPVLQDRPVQNT